MVPYMNYEEIMQKVADQTPLHNAIGLEVVEVEKGVGQISFTATEFTKNAAGVMHGGIMYAMLDVGCYVALVKSLKEGQNAVTP